MGFAFRESMSWSESLEGWRSAERGQLRCHLGVRGMTPVSAPPPGPHTCAPPVTSASCPGACTGRADSQVQRAAAVTPAPRPHSPCPAAWSNADELNEMFAVKPESGAGDDRQTKPSGVTFVTYVPGLEQERGIWASVCTLAALTLQWVPAPAR